MEHDHTYSNKSGSESETDTENSFEPSIQQQKYEDLVASLMETDCSSSCDSDIVQLRHIAWIPNENVPSYRSANLRMFEDSDDEFDRDSIIRNDVPLYQAQRNDDDIWYHSDLDNAENIELLANDEFEWIIENLDNRERMIGEEILLDQPNFWTERAMAG